MLRIMNCSNAPVALTEVLFVSQKDRMYELGTIACGSTKGIYPANSCSPT